MKLRSGLLGMVAGVVLLQQPLQAQLDLTFDWSTLGGDFTGSDGSNLWITFAGNSSSMSIGGTISESINFSGGTITYDSMSYATSKAYSLKQVMDNGLTITGASSIIAYVSYGTASGIQLQQGNPSNTVSTRYSQFEFSYSGSQGNNAGGGIDMTNISQYGGSLKVETRANNVTQAYVSNGNTLTTGDMFREMASASGYSPSAVIQDNGKFVRILGSNIFTSNNPYPTFNNYLGAMYTTQQAGSGKTLDGQIKNLAPGASHGGEGAIGVTSVAAPSSGKGVTGNTTYNIDYQFDAVVTPGTEAGTYGITLSGTVYATPALGGSTITYTGLTVTIAADSPGDPNMTNFLYLQSTSNPAAVVNFNAAWQELIDDFGLSNVQQAMQEKVAGDFGEAVAAGFIDSATQVVKDSNNVGLGTLTTWEWFNTYNQSAYSLAQTGNEYYNTFANIVYLNSPGENTQSGAGQIGNGSFSYGSVYGTPYDDRFGLNLIQPDNNTDELHITLLPDGNLVVPEPGTASLALAGALVCLGLRRRRSAGSK